MVQFPCDAPFVAADRRGAARQFRGRLVEEGNLALRVSRVDRCRDGRFRKSCARIKADWCTRYPNSRPREFPDRDRIRRPYLSRESQRACFLRDLPDS
jgi:hypothetical protein